MSVSPPQPTIPSPAAQLAVDIASRCASPVSVPELVAGVTELVDVTRSQRVGRKRVWVRIPPPAPWPLLSDVGRAYTRGTVVSESRGSDRHAKGRGFGAATFRFSARAACSAQHDA